MAALLPTKGNLLAARRSRALAATGYALMDRKRNILVREMMEMVESAKEVQGRINAVFADAYAALATASIRHGSCDGAARAVSIDDSLDIRYRSVMGVELPHIPDRTPPLRLEYGLTHTGSALDDCRAKFHAVKALVRELAEIETGIYRLAGAIQKTQKRANALQNIVIPNFDRAITGITDALEEKEREEFVRLKVIKARGRGQI